VFEGGHSCPKNKVPVMKLKRSNGGTKGTKLIRGLKNLKNPLSLSLSHSDTLTH